MFYNDHNPPHFHAKYGDFKAVIAIDTGEVIEGRLPPRVLGLVQEWREYHKAELNEDWDLARSRKALKRIEPLERVSCCRNCEKHNTDATIASG
jgi:hypothetical protein